MVDIKVPFDIPGVTDTPNPEPIQKQEETPVVENSTQEEISMQMPTQEDVKEEKKEEKPKRKVERKATREITPNDIQFVLANVKKMSYAEMAEKLGLTKNQVNRIINEIRTKLREEAEKMGKKEEVEKFIEEHLKRPAETRPGGKGEVKSAIDATVADILNKL